MTSLAGTRVLRGPDWDAGDVDGGEGFLGTVTEVLSDRKVRVLWDNGGESTCRAGCEGKFDLRVFDTAQIGVRHADTKCTSCGEENVYGTLWHCGECNGYDLCTPCYSDDKHDLRHPFWRIDAPGGDGCAVPKRNTSVKVRAIGIFSGATVTRGKDWCWDDQDGGPGSEGEVKGFENVAPNSSRNLVTVVWSNGLTNAYRLGYEGQVDLTCVEEEPGSFYYRDHLATFDTSPRCKPVVETTSSDFDNLTAILQGHRSPDSINSPSPSLTNPATSTAADKTTCAAEAANPDAVKHAESGSDIASRGDETSVTESDGQDSSGGLGVQDESVNSGEIFSSENFVVGDRVAIRVGEEKLRELQSAVGGCTARMVRCIGRTGEVTSVSATNVTLKFGPASKVSYRFNPVGLVKVPSMKEGDSVSIKPDLEQVKLFNSRVGWNSEMDATVGKVGQVTKVDDDGDVTVSFGSCKFVYAPASCVPSSQPPDTLTIRNSGVKDGAQDTGGVTSDTESLALFRKMREMVLGESSRGQGLSGMRALYTAIEMDAVDDVRDMCQRDPGMVEREYQGITPLIYASVRGRRSSVIALLELGADVNKCGDNPRKTPMSAVLEGKSEEIAELLLAKGVDLTVQYGDGHTLVHLAALRNKPLCVRELAKCGADMNVKDRFEDTPLHIAIERKKDAAMEALISLPQVDIRIANNRDFDAMQLACLYDNTRALELLLARDTSGIERLRKGHSSALTIAAANDHVECVRLLVINGGADVNRQGAKGLTALHTACHSAKLQAVEALLELGAEVNLHDEDGDTPLHLAIGGRIEGYGKSDRAEVEVACRVQIGNMLISRGAYVNAENNKGRHPFQYGVSRVRDGIATFMKSNREIVKMKKGGHRLAGLESLGLTSSHGMSRGELKEALKGVGLPCGVCGNPKSDVTLQPCQHKCVCSTCKDKVTICPLCDENVLDKVVAAPDEQHGF